MVGKENGGNAAVRRARRRTGWQIGYGELLAFGREKGAANRFRSRRRGPRGRVMSEGAWTRVNSSKGGRLELGVIKLGTTRYGELGELAGAWPGGEETRGGRRWPGGNDGGAWMRLGAASNADALQIL